MTFKDICNSLVEKLNKNNVPKNEYDEYILEFWENRAVIYHHGGRCCDKGWGAISLTDANKPCHNKEDSCRFMLLKYIKNTFGENLSDDISSAEELMLRCAIYGVELL